MNRNELISQTLAQIGKKHREIRREKGKYIRDRYQYIPQILKLLSEKASLERQELSELIKHRYVLISHGQIIPTIKAYRDLQTYLLYLESTGSAENSRYAREIANAFEGRAPESDTSPQPSAPTKTKPWKSRQ
ncbi:hypothetical protein [Desulfurispira natronophila]|uniref:Uncharacterized protein n=1 Tax=Desulfurispira natronophila TaxID=682562 RepID=A0A7W8DHR7_9BACT|nr:hypothetical protein [Desulfurispira natronophila]MBB5022724.1 hypothetical protein [Desulfurispira natronophila]